MIVEVIQFKQPDGRQVPVTLELDDNLQEKYQSLREAGCRLTAELLMDSGEVSMCIEDPDEGDFHIEVCKNEPKTPRLAMEKLIRKWDMQEYLWWKKNLAGEELEDYPEPDRDFTPPYEP